MPDNASDAMPAAASEKVLSPAAKRALEEAQVRRAAIDAQPDRYREVVDDRLGRFRLSA